MKAMRSIADSDQSVRYRQRPFHTIILLFATCVGLAACSGTPIKPAGYRAPSSATVATRSVDSTHRTTTPDERIADGDIWGRLRHGYRLQHLQHPRIEWEIDRLRRSPRALYGMLARAKPYLYDILNRIEAAELPTELALLPAVESGFRAHAYSPDGAAGLWQFMPATGRMLGLKQNWWLDQRRAPRASTDAAIRYLQRLHKRFDNDWLLALAAYNAGAGKVGRALTRAARNGDSAAFWDLDLPGETDRYIPRLLALAAVVADPPTYGIDLPEIPNRPYFVAVDIGGQLDLNVAAGLADMPIEALLALNPAHKRWATAPDGVQQLLVPIDRADTFAQALAALPADQRLRWQRHRIVRGDSLIAIARRYGVTVDVIRRANHLKGSRIRAGKNLLIPLSDQASNAAMAAVHTPRQRVRYRVREGDSLYTIARRFQVKIADLQRWNQTGRYIHPGQRLTVFIDADG